MDIAANVAALRSEIAQICASAGRDPASIKLIAVTKTQGPAVLAQLAAAGITDFGENRLDHLALMQDQPTDGWTFHGIGRVQSRQLPQWCQRCDILHSIHDPSHLKRLNQACLKQNKQVPIYIQVNTSGEDLKAGCEPKDLPDFLEKAAQLEGIQVIGLMCMAPKRAPDGTQDTVIRKAFDDLRMLADRHQLKRLSMGMSGDFDLAIHAGATEIRIGTRLFL